RRCRRAGKRRRPREAHRSTTWRPGPARRVRAETARDRLAGPVATTWIAAPLPQLGLRLGNETDFVDLSPSHVAVVSVVVARRRREQARAERAKALRFER